MRCASPPVHVVLHSGARTALTSSHPVSSLIIALAPARTARPVHRVTGLSSPGHLAARFDRVRLHTRLDQRGVHQDPPQRHAARPPATGRGAHPRAAQRLPQGRCARLAMPPRPAPSVCPPCCPSPRRLIPSIDRIALCASLPTPPDHPHPGPSSYRKVAPGAHSLVARLSQRFASSA